MITSRTLRTNFLTFFERQGHTVRDSDALIPSGDPTVLFTSAGMNQFKDYFLGKRTDLKRAASCQKCLRTGDLERVGKSASHHSFFEMLGNFSFGDYFKREAVKWGWEFLTGTLDFDGKTPSPLRELCVGLPGAKLWVSVYEDDDEAFKLWRALGVPEDRIRRFGQADNFWPANAPKEGPNGPCGPCSEIYFDADGKVQGPRSVEVWNLVFTQFDRQPDGSLKPLPRPNIDTGMGLERLTSVMQNVESDYETDLFLPIVQGIQRLPHVIGVLGEQVQFAERAIADHVRAIVFLIADGVLPSNESRGYVLRMLIRRAHRLGRTILRSPVGPPQGFLSMLVSAVEQAMRGAPYEQVLAAKRDVIRRAIEQEEQQFVQTLEAGLVLAESTIAAHRKAKVLPGAEAFKLYDTYGFPLELTIDLAEEQGLTVDRQGFEAALKAQQTRSRAASQFGQGIFVPTTLSLKEGGRSEFIGYDSLAGEARVKGIWKQDQWAQQAAAGDEVGLVLDRSPFYGEAGGQVGDQGAIEAPKGAADVVNTTWADVLLVHHARISRGTIAVNDPVRAQVDADHRIRVARSHTATHLLHWALRNVLGPETVQAGSFVEAERIRFDFSALAGLHEEQRAKVEQLVNDRVRAADDVCTTLMKLDEAKRAGAMALFGEKYGHEVRVVSIGDYSRELCGGTHLVHTGAIGVFRIIEESSIAAGTRRVEALVGEAALLRQQQESAVLKQVAQRVSRAPQEALQGVEELAGQLKTLEKQAKTLKMELAQVRTRQLIADAKRIDGVTFVATQIEGADRELLAALADAIRSQLSSGVAVLVAVEKPSTIAWVMAVTADLVKRGLHAGELLKSVSAITKGGGGGRPDFAQAGGKDPSAIPAALQRAEVLVREALTR